MRLDQNKCAHCDKIIHKTQQCAARAATAFRKRGHGTVKPYRCPYGHWHLTKMASEPSREVRTRKFWDGRYLKYASASQ